MDSILHFFSRQVFFDCVYPLLGTGTDQAPHLCVERMNEDRPVSSEKLPAFTEVRLLTKMEVAWLYNKLSTFTLF